MSDEWSLMSHSIHIIHHFRDNDDGTTFHIFFTNVANLNPWSLM